MTVENTRLKASGKQKGSFTSYCHSCKLIEGKAYAKRYAAEWPEKMAENERNRQQKFLTRINFLKAERPCYDCGGVFPPEAMDFDHISGKKLFQVAQGKSHRWEIVREEIDKCQLVCSNCHRIRTKQRREFKTLKE